MNKLVELQIKRNKTIEELNREIKEERQFQHIELSFSHRNYFKILDIAVILIVLMNFGALFMTNVMVHKVAADAGEVVVHKELNPSTAEAGGFTQGDTPEEIAETNKLWALVVRTALIWVGLISLYVFERRNVHSTEMLTALTIMVAIYGLVLGYDFINDLGYFLGRIWFGG